MVAAVVAKVVIHGRIGELEVIDRLAAVVTNDGDIVHMENREHQVAVGRQHGDGGDHSFPGSRHV